MFIINRIVVVVVVVVVESLRVEEVIKSQPAGSPADERRDQFGE